MKRLTLYTIVGISLIGGAAFAQEATDSKKLEAAVVAAANGSPAQQRAMEDDLIASLSTATSREERSLLCRMLRRVGTARSVKALSDLLGNEESGHMARFALASIPGEAASTAMRKAVPEVSETLQIGLLHSLAQRGDLESLTLFREGVDSESRPVRLVSIQGLGLLGNEDAAAILRGLRSRSPDVSLIDDALLTSAESLLASGERGVAREIFVGLSGSDQSHQRIAGLRGLSEINDLHAKRVVEGALADADLTVQRSALRLMMTMAGGEAVPIMIEMAPGLSKPQQETVIHWLGEQGDATARATVTAFAQSQDVALQAAAVKALGALGDGSSVPLLLAHIDDAESAVRNAARESLMRLQGDSIDPALINALKDNPNPDLVNLMSGRGVRTAFPDLLNLSRTGEGETRKAAIKALGSLAQADQLPELVALLLDPTMEGETKSVESAILGAYREIADPDERAAPVLAAYEGAPDQMKPDLVNLLGRAGSGKALAGVRDALNSALPAVRNAAVHTLSRWPSSEPIEDLYALAQSASDQGHRVVALRGYVSMAEKLENAAERYRKALALAKSPEDQKLVLAGLAKTRSLEALKLCQGYLSDEKVSIEAALACIQISRRVWREATDEVEALMKSFEDHEDETVQKQAAQVLERIVR